MNAWISGRNGCSALGCCCSNAGRTTAGVHAHNIGISLVRQRTVGHQGHALEYRCISSRTPYSRVWSGTISIQYPESILHIRTERTLDLPKPCAVCTPWAPRTPSASPQTGSVRPRGRRKTGRPRCRPCDRPKAATTVSVPDPVSTDDEEDEER